jgi:hypothetical protein
MRFQYYRKVGRYNLDIVMKEEKYAESAWQFG